MEEVRREIGEKEDPAPGPAGGDGGLPYGNDGEMESSRCTQDIFLIIKLYLKAEWQVLMADLNTP